jgi:glutamate carboxypeptidase
MPFVIFGAGAIGGVVGARLHRAGFDVALIARGAHYEAIREHGLTLEQPDASPEVLEIRAADSPQGLQWTGQEVVMLATKSQDTAGALASLRAAAPIATPVMCVQNGVENERIALRSMPNVYGAVVMAPTTHLAPGIVQAYGTRSPGVIDVGRYPSGVDAVCEKVAQALGEAGFSSAPRPDIMRFKYAKLLANLGNAVDAICERGPVSQDVTELAREEGRAALTAAGIEFGTSANAGRRARCPARRSWRTPERDTTRMDQFVADGAAEIASRAQRELEALVAVSSPSGDVEGAEEAIALCAAFLPPQATVERVPCSTPGSAPDMLARIDGRGSRRLLLLGHVDTVIEHSSHAPLRRDGDRLHGPGTVDMKGGVVLSLGVARALAARPEAFDEVAVLLVTDEEWRVEPFRHVERFASYDACLCFEGGQLTRDGEEGVVVRRKAAGTMRVAATGRAAHSGSAPDQGRNALLALAATAIEISRHHDPAGAERLSVVPTVVRSGDAFNVVPADGELLFDMRADRSESFEAVCGAVPDELDGVRLECKLQRVWPGMDSREATAELLERAGARLGRRIVGVPRGGASDASHFAPSIPLTVDGLGPRGGGAHTPEEFVLARSLRERAEVALAVAAQVLE